MVFGTDPEQRARIHWQFCQPGALPLGFPSPFGSHYFQEYRELLGPLGEVQGTYKNDYGPTVAPPIGVAVAPGTSPACGDPGVWKNGYPGKVPHCFSRNGFGLLNCCGGLLDDPGSPTLGLVPQPNTYLAQEDLGLILQENGDKLIVTENP
jgi:hypothetical protein